MIIQINVRKPIKIFIGNVPHEATSKDLRTVFEDSGLEIHKCDKVCHGVDVENAYDGYDPLKNSELCRIRYSMTSMET